MATNLNTIDTKHDDMIHDAQLDYYGKRLATASSDRTIKIFEDIENSPGTLVAELKGHEGPVWQVAWSHPKYESLLASCSYDRRVIIWKATSKNVWEKIYEYNKHQSSVNSIAWAPHEFGLILACGSSDSTISIHTYKAAESTWETKTIEAHPLGVNAVSWAPALSKDSNPNNPIKRIVSGGCDNHVKIWRFSDADNNWRQEDVGEMLDKHTDWVRDVAWAPNIGVPSSTIASCSQDGTVIIWTQDFNSSHWSPKSLPKFPDVVWRLSWSITGNILAVSGGDNKVTLWKEGLDSEWTCISSVEEESNQTQQQ